MKDKHSRLSRIFRGIKDRCYNINSPVFKDYGARNITICAEWNNRERIKFNGKNSTKGWIAFEKWALSHGYQDNLTIDRIDNNKGYSPENCRWVTIKTQQNNKRNNKLITYKGKTQTAAQWCDELNLNYETVLSRLKLYHWSIEKTFKNKNNPQLKMLSYKGKTQSLSQWCKELNLNYFTVKDRLNKLHWSVEKAFEFKRSKK